MQPYIRSLCVGLPKNKTKISNKGSFCSKIAKLFAYENFPFYSIRCRQYHSALPHAFISENTVQAGCFVVVVVVVAAAAAAAVVVVAECV